MQFRVFFLALLAGCSTTTPSSLTDSDRLAVRDVLTRIPNLRVPPSEFDISDVDVRDGKHVVLLALSDQGFGWRETQQIHCLKQNVFSPWRCSEPYTEVTAEIPGGGSARVDNLSGAAAARAVQFLDAVARSEPGPTDLSTDELKTIDCLAGEASGSVTVQFAGVPHHASYSPGLLTLRSLEGSPEIASIERPSWGEPTLVPQVCISENLYLYSFE
jgi:hypothetical protein